MDELLGQVGLVQGGAAALVTVIVVLVLLGRLIPRSQVEDRLKDRDQQIKALRTERDTWRAAYEESERARDLLRDQALAGLEAAQTTNQLLAGLPAIQRQGVTAHAVATDTTAS